MVFGRGGVVVDFCSGFCVELVFFGLGFIEGKNF